MEYHLQVFPHEPSIHRVHPWINEKEDLGGDEKCHVKETLK